MQTTSSSSSSSSSYRGCAFNYATYYFLEDEAARTAYADLCDWSKLEVPAASDKVQQMTGLGRLIWHTAVHREDDEEGPVSKMLRCPHEIHNRRAAALSAPDGTGQRPVDLALFYQDAAGVLELLRLGARLDIDPRLRLDTDWTRRRSLMLAQTVAANGVVAVRVV